MTGDGGVTGAAPAGWHGVAGRFISPSKYRVRHDRRRDRCLHRQSISRRQMARWRSAESLEHVEGFPGQPRAD